MLISDKKLKKNCSIKTLSNLWANIKFKKIFVLTRRKMRTNKESLLNEQKIIAVEQRKMKETQKKDRMGKQ